MAVCLPISDPLAFLIAVVGILLSSGYILKQGFFPSKTEYDDGVEKTVTEWLNEKKEKGLYKDKIDIILKDYETANGEIARRDNITLIVGTILVGSSFFILGNMAVKPSQAIGVYALASVSLFCVWLLVLHDTAKRLNELTYGRIRAMENALTKSLMNGQIKGDQECYRFGIHSYVHEQTKEQTVRWLLLRRTFWAIVLFFLSFSWMLLSISAEIV